MISTAVEPALDPLPNVGIAQNFVTTTDGQRTIFCMHFRKAPRIQVRCILPPVMPPRKLQWIANLGPTGRIAFAYGRNETNEGGRLDRLNIDVVKEDGGDKTKEDEEATMI